MEYKNYAEYMKCMELIKARIAIIDQINNKQFTSNSLIIDNEILSLQYRIIFELIALSSLCSHKESYEQVRKSFNKEWRASKIIKTVESINPEFFPVPYSDERGPKGIKINDIQKDALTKSELIKFHGISGNYLHQKNPYDIDEQINPFVGNKVRNKIAHLLSQHRVWLYHESKMILVLMNTIPTGKITIQPLGLIEQEKGTYIGHKIK